MLKSIGIAFFSSLCSMYFLIPLGKRLGWVDHPNARKWHKEAVPVIGGFSMFIGFCAALLSLDTSWLMVMIIMGASGLLMLIGMIDDLNEIHALPRLCVQLIAAVLISHGTHRVLTHLGNLYFGGPIELGKWGMPMTLLLMVTNMNAMNMIDGQDGLAGGVAFFQAIGLLVLSWQVMGYLDIHLLAILIVVLGVFLSFNMRFPWRKRAAIFMGDAGSTFIALILAYLAIRLSQDNRMLVKPITVLWVMSFPIFDLISIVILRLRQARPVFAAGRDHVHYILRSSGLNTMVSTWILCSFSLGLGGIGWVMRYFLVPEPWQFMLWCFMLLLYMTIFNYMRKATEENTVLLYE